MPTILGTIDRGGDGKAILLALVNQVESSNLQSADFEFSNPITPTEVSPVRNTKIKLAPKASSGYYGVKTIWYNRIHVSELGSITVLKGSATRVVHLLDQINEAYGILITATDIVDEALPPANLDGTVNFFLNFSATSIVFYGGVQITPVTNPEAGTLVSTFCDGTTQKGIYNNGAGGTYTAVIETNSVTCGYIAPPANNSFDYGLLLTGNRGVENSLLGNITTNNYVIQVAKNKIDTQAKQNVVRGQVALTSYKRLQIYNETNAFIYNGSLLVDVSNDFVSTWYQNNKIIAMNAFGSTYESTDNGATWTFKLNIKTFNDTTTATNGSVHYVSKVKFGINGVVVALVKYVEYGINTGFPTTEHSEFVISFDYGETWGLVNGTIDLDGRLNVYKDEFIIDKNNALYFVACVQPINLVTNEQSFTDLVYCQINETALSFNSISGGGSSDFLSCFTGIGDVVTTLIDVNKIIFSESDNHIHVYVIGTNRGISVNTYSLSEINISIADKISTSSNFIEIDDFFIKDHSLTHELALQKAFAVTAYDAVAGKTRDENLIKTVFLPYTLNGSNYIRAYNYHCSNANYVFNDYQLNGNTFRQLETITNGVKQNVIVSDNDGIYKLSFNWNDFDYLYWVDYSTNIDFSQVPLDQGIKTIAIKPLAVNETPWYEYGPLFMSPVTFDVYTPPPWYSLSLDNYPNLSVNEGAGINFGVNTGNVPDGTVVYWSLLHGTTNASDFVTTSGQMTISQGYCADSLSIVADATTEGPKTFGMEIRTESFTGPVVSFVPNTWVTINDTSTTPATPTYTLAPVSATDRDEGFIFIITSDTTNVPVDTVLYWTINHGTTLSSDFVADSGQFTQTSNTVDFTITSIEDLTTEGPESFGVQLRTGSIAGPIVASIANTGFTINDTSVTPVAPAAVMTLDPATANSNLVLSNNNLTVSNLTSTRNVRTNNGISSGKKYWEVQSNNAIGGFTYVRAITGVGILSVPDTEGLGSTSNSWGWGGSTGYRYHAGGYTTTATGWSSNADVIGHALDMDAGTLTLYKNGVDIGVVFTGITGTVYPMLCGDDGSYVSGAMTANFGSRMFKYNPPSGFSGIQNKILNAVPSNVDINTPFVDTLTPARTFTCGGVNPVYQTNLAISPDPMVYFNQNGFIEVSDVGDFDITNPNFSIRIVCAPDISIANALVSKRSNGTNGWVINTSTDGSVYLRINFNGSWHEGYNSTATGLITNLTLVEITLARENDLLNLYVNKTLASSVNIGLTGYINNDINSPLRFGVATNINEQLYKGYIKSVEVFNGVAVI